jgi:predicted Zn-dependent peptidase
VAPVFSFATIVDVGSAQEVPGITGLAHMFEHMAFKGTQVIGTTDYKAEKIALAEVEKAYLAYDDARHDPGRTPEEIATLEETFSAKQDAAFAYVKSNEFGELINRNGGVGLNAFTNTDVTGYFYSLPANKIELFAYLESERFLNPVFREFYKERDVVQEERRMRTESNPIGRLVEQMTSTAFVAHPYKQPVVGYMSDLESFTSTDAKAFFKKYYVPSNMVTALVGHFETDELIPLLDRYFGRIPKGPKPPRLRTTEPPQIVEKKIVMVDAAQPLYIEGYHTGSANDPDQAVYDAIDAILSGGRTSRLYRSLVVEKKIAAQVGSFSGFPGAKYPGLWLALAFPAKDVTNEQVQEAIHHEIARLQNEDVTDEELARFKTQAKASLLRGLQDNQGLAFQLAMAQQLHGDWRELFRRVDAYEAVSKEAIRRVAAETFVPSNRTIGMIINEKSREADQGGDAASGN